VLRLEAVALLSGLLPEDLAHLESRLKPLADYAYRFTMAEIAAKAASTDLR
jgi:hypothetical protein